MNSVSKWHQDAILLSEDEFLQWGTTLVVAPHQDDESLGCGGTIALLRKAGIKVHVVFVSDGSLSHPNSVKYPRKRLISTREQEAIIALDILGVDANNIIFLHLQDGSLPSKQDADFPSAVEIASDVVNTIQPTTILLPWRRDPHPDHRATWQIFNEAISQAAVNSRIKCLEYFIWLWERAVMDDLPLKGEMTILKISTGEVTELKTKAIAAHVSQTTSLIDDDPEGFVLSEEMLDHFKDSSELFAAPINSLNN